MNIYEKLEEFIEAESYSITQSIVDHDELTLGDLKDKADIIPLFSEAIRKLFAENYDGEALEMVFSQNEENFFNTHMSSWIQMLKDCIKDNEW